MTKPLASLSIDLDNKWCYLRTHGAAGWDKYPSFLNVAVPRVLRACNARNVRLTAFIVGQDAARDENVDALASIANAGHEIGNHTLNHEPWLNTLPRPQLENEIAAAEELIERATGRRPIGFRSPAYSLSDDVLEILVERGYEYDGSTLPTYLGPLARWYFRHTATHAAAEEAEERELFGSLSDGLRPIKPYPWNTAAGPIVEIPVTTLPLLKLPIHMTYLMYLWQFSPRAARTYFSLALLASRMWRIRPSMLLHPLDFLGAEDDAEMRFFPGMGVPRDEKLAFVDEVLAKLSKTYHVVPMVEQARELRALWGLPTANAIPQAAVATSSV
jgi:peptidoglycan/xylan/chitin deacetylase (PgdA/CDA1 family)